MKAVFHGWRVVLIARKEVVDKGRRIINLHWDAVCIHCRGDWIYNPPRKLWNFREFRYESGEAGRQAGRATGLATFAAEDRVGHRVTHMMLVYPSSLRNTRRLDYTRSRGGYAVSSFLIAPRSPPRPPEKSNRLREGDNIPIDRGIRSFQWCQASCKPIVGYTQALQRRRWRFVVRASIRSISTACSARRWNSSLRRC